MYFEAFAPSAPKMHVLLSGIENACIPASFGAESVGILMRVGTSGTENACILKRLGTSGTQNACILNSTPPVPQMLVFCNVSALPAPQYIAMRV